MRGMCGVCEFGVHGVFVCVHVSCVVCVYVCVQISKSFHVWLRAENREQGADLQHQLPSELSLTHGPRRAKKAC